MNDYLPEWATADEATAWLEKRTGEQWPLARILEEVQPGLSVWLDYSPEFPDVFQGRTEGFLAEMVFHGDARRLTVAREGLLTWTRRPDGAHLSITPGARFDVGDLRIRGADLEQLTAAAAAALPSKDARQDRRLSACEAAGLVMPTSELGRLPDGIAKIAKAEGVARQSFTEDVKAALKRRAIKSREGRA